MKIAGVDTDREVFVIAEVGNNHEGSFSLAEDLVGKAAEAGAHAVKFQTFKTEYYISPGNHDRFKRLKSFELTYQQFEKLSILAKKLGLIFISTPLDLESAAFLNTIVDAFKISSGDSNFYQLITEVSATGKPLIMSSGMTEMAQLKTSKNLVEKIWCDHNLNQSLAVLHCVSSYPTPLDQANLGVIQKLKSDLGCTVGYSDHTLGIAAATLSVAAGARIIEKHFTLNKNHSSFRDHQLSADPKEMAQLVKNVKEANAMLGTGEKVIQEAEKATIIEARRSIVANKNLITGHKIQLEDLTWLRPGTGLAPGNEDKVLGKALNNPVKSGEVILLNMVH